MKFKSIIITGLFLILSVGFFSFGKKSQIRKLYRSVSSSTISNDTLFVPNEEDGWSSMSCYFNRGNTDSTDFEIIIKNDNQVTDWNREQFIGIITRQNFLPLKEVSVKYELLPENVWNVRISPGGEVYITILKGIGPSEAPMIIPIKINYSNKE